jgi:hypothetical protein
MPEQTRHHRELEERDTIPIAHGGPAEMLSERQGELAKETIVQLTGEVDPTL